MTHKGREIHYHAACTAPLRRVASAMHSPSVAPLAPDENRKTEGFNAWWDEESDGLKSRKSEASGGKRTREADTVVHLQTPLESL
jgi:hypothetical protein